MEMSGGVSRDVCCVTRRVSPLLKNVPHIDLKSLTTPPRQKFILNTRKSIFAKKRKYCILNGNEKYNQIILKFWAIGFGQFYKFAPFGDRAFVQSSPWFND